MSLNDLRAFLKLLEDEGEIVFIDKEVDPKFDIGAFTLAAYMRGKLKSEPCLFFRNVKGHDIPVVTNIFGTYKRYALAFGLEEDSLFDGLLRRCGTLVPPKIVDQAPCKECRIVGEGVDLGKFPLVWWNALDAGPYITSGLVITKDISTGAHNVGRYRAQVKGNKKCVILVSERQDIGRHYIVARDSGAKQLDVAIAIGCEPALEIASVTTIPHEWEEYRWAGGLKGDGEPVDLVAAETVDLFVPATAEIILEGRLNIGEFEEEGPIGEFTGYYTGGYASPVMHLTAITHRKRPIMTGIHMGRALGENLLIGHYSDTVMLYREIKRNVPELTDLKYMFSWYTLIVQVSKKKKYVGIAKRVADCVWANKVGSFCKNIIVIDDDVDINDPFQIFWALSVRSQPDQDVSVYGNCPGYGIDPSEREAAVRSIGGRGVSRITSRLLWDATEPIFFYPTVRVIDPPPGFDDVWRAYDEVVHGVATERLTVGSPL